MKKGKRILALFGVVLLAGIYILTFLSAFMASPASAGLFKASIFCTVAVPVLLYGYLLIYKVLKKHREEEQKYYEQTRKDFDKKDS